MPIVPNLPNNLYGGTAVVLDTAKNELNQYNQLLAKEQAKDEAINQYMTNRLDRINTAGVEDIHIKSDPNGKFIGMEEDINLLRRGWTDNKKEIRMEGEAKRNWETQYNSILRKAQSAQNRNALLKKIHEIQFTGKHKFTVADLEIIKKIGGSVYDPSTYKADGVSDYGLEDLSVMSPEFKQIDQNRKYDAAFKNMPKVKTFDESKRTIDKQTGTVRTPYVMELSKKQLEDGGNVYADSLTENELSHYDRAMTNDNSMFLRYNPIFKSVYGTDIDTPKDLAKAMVIHRAMLERKEDVLIQSDWEARQARIDIRSFFHGTDKKKDSDDWEEFNIKEIIMPDGTFNMTKAVRGIDVFESRKGQGVRAADVNYDVRTDKVKYEYPDALSPSGTTTDTVSRPEFIIRMTALGQNTAIQIKNLKAGFQKIRKEMGMDDGGKQKTQSTKPTGKTMTRAEYNKMTLTEKQAFNNSGGTVK
jgi:hypothetical protein